MRTTTIGAILLLSTFLCGPLTAAETPEPRVSLSQPIVLPPAKTDADITLTLPSHATEKSSVHVLPLLDANGAELPVQPTVTSTSSSNGTLALHFSNLFFWGKVTLQIQFQPGPLAAYGLVRGPKLTKADLTIDDRTAARLWFYNFDTKPVELRWRITSGSDSVCGQDKAGAPQTVCDSPEQWPKVTLGAARTDALLVRIPAAWFPSLGGSIRRPAQLELLYGSDLAASPMARTNIVFELNRPWVDVILPASPSEPTPQDVIVNLLWVVFWVTLGASLLMLAQVMIPNFTKCLQMESQLDSIGAALKGIDSSVGDQLWSRCQQELDKVRRSLFMNSAEELSDTDTGTVKSIVNWLRRLSLSGVRGRLLLSGNSAGVKAIAALLPGVESRVNLTQKLSDTKIILRSDIGRLPLSLCRDRQRRVDEIQRLLVKQMITNSDEDSISAALDKMVDDTAALADFASDLESRLAVLRKQFAAQPLNAQSAELLAKLGNCRAVLDPASPDFRPGLLELVYRDLCAVRLDLIRQRFELDTLLSAERKQLFALQICSNSTIALESIQSTLSEVSEFITEEQVKNAIVEGLFDVIVAPVVVRDGDVLVLSFRLCKDDLQNSSARKTFKCDWQIKNLRDNAEDAGFYLDGWETQYMLGPGDYEIAPRIRDADGNPVVFKKSRQAKVTVTPAHRNQLFARASRGLVDALITALVPVITVAVTQFQTGGNISFLKLALLGFTSQAIRAAVLPDSAGSPEAASPAKPSK